MKTHISLTWQKLVVLFAGGAIGVMLITFSKMFDSDLAGGGKQRPYPMDLLLSFSMICENIAIDHGSDADFAKQIYDGNQSSESIFNELIMNSIANRSDKLPFRTIVERTSSNPSTAAEILQYGKSLPWGPMLAGYMVRGQHKDKDLHREEGKK